MQRWLVILWYITTRARGFQVVQIFMKIKQIV